MHFSFSFFEESLKGVTAFSGIFYVISSIYYSSSAFWVDLDSNSTELAMDNM